MLQMKFLILISLTFFNFYPNFSGVNAPCMDKNEKVSKKSVDSLNFPSQEFKELIQDLNDRGIINIKSIKDILIVNEPEKVSETLKLQGKEYYSQYLTSISYVDCILNTLQGDTVKIEEWLFNRKWCLQQDSINSQERFIDMCHAIDIDVQLKNIIPKGISLIYLRYNSDRINNEVEELTQIITDTMKPVH